VHSGVFVPRRDTSSWLTAFGGGRLFPGEQNRAHFEVREDERHFHIAMDSRDGSTRLVVEGEITSDLPSDSVFSSVDEASRFFASGSLGYSPNSSTGVASSIT
jgi:hypothetical protein